VGEEYTVKDLMVPLSKYATISENTSILEAIAKLAKSQQHLEEDRDKNRAVLVLAKDGTIIGKLTQLDALKALEPRYQKIQEHPGMLKYGFSGDFVKLSLEKFNLWDLSLEHICGRIVHRKVKEVMTTPAKDEYIDEDVSLSVAIHQLITGNHQSLLVKRGQQIIGVLRLTDVFSGIYQILDNYCRQTTPP
jgi:CBS domain-containing protein